MTRRRILVLEDHDAHREMLVARLRSFPTRAEVIACSRVAEAVREIRLAPFSAAILDMQLPDGSGPDVIPLLGEARIIIATASPEEVPREVRQAHPVVAKGPGWIAKIEELLRQ